MKIQKHNTAGCYLVRKNHDDWEIILIYKRWAEDNQGWVAPKGHIEKGESNEQAAIRETIEETGYKNIRIIQSLDTLHIKYSWDDGFMHHKAIHYFLAELINDQHVEPNLSEQEKLSTVKTEWLSLKDAEEKMMFDDEREVLRKAIRVL